MRQTALLAALIFTLAYGVFPALAQTTVAPAKPLPSAVAAPKLAPVAAAKVAPLPKPAPVPTDSARPAPTLPQHPGIRIADVPRAFQGEYSWNRGRRPWMVALTIERMDQMPTGEILFLGRHAYSPGGYEMIVHGRLDPRTSRVSMVESRPTRPESIIDGEFEGTISTELSTINCLWTSARSGGTGRYDVSVPKERSGHPTMAPPEPSALPKQ